MPQLQGVPAGPEGPNILAELTDVAVVRAHDLHTHTSNGAVGVGGVLYAVDEGKALAVLWDGHLRGSGQASMREGVLLLCWHGGLRCWLTHLEVPALEEAPVAAIVVVPAVRRQQVRHARSVGSAVSRPLLLWVLGSLRGSCPMLLVLLLLPDPQARDVPSAGSDVCGARCSLCG